MKNLKDASLEELILLVIDSIVKSKKKCTFDQIVKRGFDLFPAAFSLTEFPEHPDSLKLDRPLRDIREKGLIKGSPTTFYSMTDFGKAVLDKIKAKYRPRENTGQEKKTTRSPALITLVRIKRSQDFRHFLKKRGDFKPNNMRIRELLRFTLETPEREIRNYLEYLKNFAEERNEEPIIAYLNIYIAYFSKRGK